MANRKSKEKNIISDQLKYSTVCLIHFDQFGTDEEGYLHVAAYEKDIPFGIRRVFWVHSTPEHIKRGRHAHHETEMVLIALKGEIRVDTIFRKENKSFILNKPDIGLYMPAYCWHEMHYSDDAVQLVLASSDYNPEDYIRDLGDFQKLNND